MAAGCECGGFNLDHCILGKLRISNKYMYNEDLKFYHLQLRD
jgi:hypothetical protein